MLAVSEDEQRYRAVLWALSKVDRDLTSDDETFRLEESLADINEMETQQTRIKEAKRLLKLCHFAGLIDALATKNNLIDEASNRCETPSRMFPPLAPSTVWTASESQTLEC
jgi:hypothetical protein